MTCDDHHPDELDPAALDRLRANLAVRVRVRVDDAAAAMVLGEPDRVGPLPVAAPLRPRLPGPLGA